MIAFVVTRVDLSSGSRRAIVNGFSKPATDGGFRTKRVVRRVAGKARITLHRCRHMERAIHHAVAPRRCSVGRQPDKRQSQGARAHPPSPRGPVHSRALPLGGRDAPQQVPCTPLLSTARSLPVPDNCGLHGGDSRGAVRGDGKRTAATAGWGQTGELYG